MSKDRLPRIYFSGAKAPLTDITLSKFKIRPDDDDYHYLLLDEAMLATGEAYAITASDNNSDPVALPDYEILPSMGLIKFAEALPDEATEFLISGNLHTKSEVGFATSYNIQATINTNDITTTKDLLDNEQWTETEVTSRNGTIDIEGIYDRAGDFIDNIDNPVQVEIKYNGGARIFLAQGKASSEALGGGVGDIQTYNLTLTTNGRIGYIYP